MNTSERVATTHTPGPWAFDGVRVYAPALDEQAPVTMPDGEERMHGMGLIALPYSCGPLGSPCGAHEANARLIAAAPDLLAALIGLLELGRKDTSNTKYNSFYESARAAIKKAEGGQS